MKVLVLGAGGMAGHVIALRLMEYGHMVTGLARRSLPFCESIVADVTNKNVLQQVIINGCYDAVVNAIGCLPRNILKKPANGIWLNAYLPHMLVEVTDALPTRIIHLSTDCIFNGHGKGGYSEKSFPDANDYYGRSKKLGEIDDEKNLTFRMSIVGPDINEQGIGLFHWFMLQNEKVLGYNNAIWSGVSTITLADAIHMALQQKTTGLYHLVNNDFINKYELLKLFNDLREEPVDIIPSDTYIVDKSMVCTRNDFDFTVPSYFEMVEQIEYWIRSYVELYPYYRLKERYNEKT